MDAYCDNVEKHQGFVAPWLPDDKGALVKTDDKHVKLANGVEMPLVNLGGVSSSPSNYSEFLALGGRGIDTAATYGDQIQRDVAAAVKRATVPRSEIFLTSKVPCCPEAWGTDCVNPEFDKGVAANIALDMKLLGPKPIDLLLLHWPCAGAHAVVDTLAAWRGKDPLYISLSLSLSL